MKIKPCPFCGVKPRISGMEKVTPFRAICDNSKCPHRYSYHTREEAIKAWNKRMEEK